MANNGNLVVPSSEQAREYGRRGKIASDKAKRKKKAFQAIASELLGGGLTEPMKQKMRDVGYSEEEIANMDVFTCIFNSCLDKAMNKGDAYSLESLMRIAGYSTEHERLKLQREELKNRFTTAQGVEGGVIEIPAVVEVSEGGENGE